MRDLGDSNDQDGICTQFDFEPYLGCIQGVAFYKVREHCLKPLFSSPEHEVLMVSYCDQSLSVIRRQQFVLKANSS